MLCSEPIRSRGRRERQQGEPSAKPRASRDLAEGEGWQLRPIWLCTKPYWGSQLIPKVCEVDPLLCPSCGATMPGAAPPVVSRAALLVDFTSLRRRLAHLGFTPVPGVEVLPSARDLHRSGQQAHPARDSLADVTQEFGQTVAEARIWLLMVHAAATLYMTGLIWFVQTVHYPLLSRVGQSEFSGYEREHVRRTGWVVAGPMLAEVICSAAVVWVVGGWLAWTGLALVGVIWISTGLWQVPAHRQLEAGFDATAHVRLTRTNWVRTAAWTARSVIALVLAAMFG